MKLLLDTHAFVWAIGQPHRLSSRVAGLLTDPSSAVFVSVASAYEIEFKRSRDPVLAALPADLDEAMRLHRYAWLPILSAHATLAGRLSRLAGDPFDRLLAAQALIEDATLLSRDPVMAAYGAVTIW